MTTMLPPGVSLGDSKPGAVLSTSAWSGEGTSASEVQELESAGQTRKVEKDAVDGRAKRGRGNSAR